MKILYVLEHYYPNKGGVERLFKGVAENLSKQQHRVTVITTQLDNKSPTHEVIHGVEIIRLPLKNRFLFTFLSLPYIIFYARKVDLIHTTSYNAALPAWLAAFFTRKKIIITFHEVWDSLWWNLPYYNLASKLLFFFFEKIILMLPFDYYIAVSESTKQSLIKAGIHASLISRIYNGIDYDDFEKYQHQPPQTPTICYYGRLGASKGLDLLLDSLASVKIRYKLLLIIPDQPKFIYKRVSHQLNLLKLEDKTIIKSDLSDQELFNAISKTSFVVIPSLSEGFCFNAVECAAINIPLVVSANTALLETVSGKHIYIENKDIYSAIIKALNNNWDSIPVTYFKLSDTVHDYIEIYKKLTS